MSTPAGKPVWISGAGVVSCIGRSPEQLWENAIAARTGIREGLGSVADSGDDPGFRALRFAEEAALQAISCAEWDDLEDDVGLILATTTGQIHLWDRDLVGFLRKEVSRAELAKVFRHQSLGSLLDGLRSRLRHSGRSVLVTSACAASTQALAIGAMWIQQGRVKRCLVGGVEVLCPLTVEGFKSLQLLSRTPSRPFDRDRSGINLSEGAGFIALQADRPQFPLGRLDGYGMSTDGFHMTGPQPEGKGSLAAMRTALATAGLRPSEVSWVHAHGTGSSANDLAEGFALASLFEGRTPHVTSTKWIHGHALGASGVIETVLCLQALRHQVALKTGGLESPDEKIPVRALMQDQSMDLKHILKNTLGFGGINAAVVISRADARDS